jgi:MFS family permease
VLLAIVLTGQFMALVDSSIVNVAIPSIHASLRTSGAGLQLVVAGYTIAYAVLLVTGARLGDILGHRRMFLAGLVAFTLASLGCGLAPTAGSLIALRVIQGAGAAAMIPQVLSLIQRTFTGAARTRAMSTYSAVLAGGAVVGQVVGGLLISADLAGSTWRPVFLVNVPVGVVLAVAGLRYLPAGHGAGGPSADSLTADSLTADRATAGRPRADWSRVDPAGLVTLACAVFALVLPLVLGQAEHWPVWGWALLAAGAVLIVVFVVVERRLAAAGGAPIVPGRVLRLPGAALGIVGVFVTMAVFGGFFFSFALQLQSGLGDSPLRAGLTFAPAAATFGLVSLSWRRLPARGHEALIIGGFAVCAASLLRLASLIHGGGSGGAQTYVMEALFGLGMAAAFSPLLTRVLLRVPVADAADATGVIVTVVQLALVVGVATFGTLYLNLAGSLPTIPGGAFRLLSAHAESVTCVALAVAALGGAAVAALRAATSGRAGAVPASDIGQPVPARRAG